MWIWVTEAASVRKRRPGNSGAVAGLSTLHELAVRFTKTWTVAAKETVKVRLKSSTRSAQAS